MGSLFSQAWFRWTAIAVLGILIGLAIIIIFFTRPKLSGQSAEQHVFAEVKKHVLLPTDETPALATVTDPSKLQAGSFLAESKKGDEVLIFAKWKRAVIYRPTIDRVIDIGAVDVSPSGGGQGYSPLN